MRPQAPAPLNCTGSRGCASAHTHACMHASSADSAATAAAQAMPAQAALAAMASVQHCGEMMLHDSSALVLIHCWVVTLALVGPRSQPSWCCMHSVGAHFGTHRAVRAGEMCKQGAPIRLVACSLCVHADCAAPSCGTAVVLGGTVQLMLRFPVQTCCCGSVSRRRMLQSGPFLYVTSSCLLRTRHA
jgi:hypothetical protein